MKEVTIKQSRLEFAFEMMDKDIMRLMRKAECYGCESLITISYLDEIKGSLAILMYLGLISSEEFHNITACLHGFIFGFLDLDSDEE